MTLAGRLGFAIVMGAALSGCPDPVTDPEDTEAPTTSANPAGGTFDGSVTVSLTCDDADGSGCAATHYTTDGSTPSTSSSRYGAPLQLTATTTLRFFSVDQDGYAEAPHSQQYEIRHSSTDTTPPTTVASPPATSSTSPLDVT